MKQKTANTASPEASPAPVRVAYHDGPPDIGFLGINWQRGVAQEVTHSTWSAMQSRSDFAHFDFRIEPETPADKE